MSEHSRPRRSASRGLAALLLLFGALVPARPTAAQATADPGASAVAHPANWPKLPGGVLIRPAIEVYLDDLMAHMTLQEKVGQMVQADISTFAPADLARYPLGSVLAGGFAAPANDVHSSAAAWKSMVGAYKAAALAAPHGAHPPIPVIFGIDAVHGNAKIRGATIFPHNVGLGAAHDSALIRSIGEATAQEVAAIGVDWAFAPTVAVARDARWGRAYESYSDDPALVAAYAASMVAGLQGTVGSPQFLGSDTVIASAKHFLGDGGTVDGRDQGNNLDSEAVLSDVHGAGYRAAVQAGVASIMASYNSWHGVKMHANRSLLTGVLKDRWGFDGFVVGDWNAQEEVAGCTKFDCAAVVNAGVDMVMAPDSWKQMYTNLLHQARTGEIPAARIDDAARRILRVKALAGLIGPLQRPAAAPSREGPPVEGLPFDVIGDAAHRALARQAVRESLVLLKNAGGLLPLAPRQHVLVVGAAADSIGTQSGGWTVDWQGASNTNADLPRATSIFAGIRAAVSAAGGTATLSADGSYAAKPDVAIVVYGEQPYAEFEGDRETLVLPQSDATRAMLQRLRAAGIKVVSVLLSGRPLWVNPELNQSDAFVAAWLPGSEGGGVADLLFTGADGAHRDFTGRLSFPWPASGLPVSTSPQSVVTGMLYPRGYGLAAGQASPPAMLTENAGVPLRDAAHAAFYADAHVIAPWSIYAGDSLAEVRMTQASLTSPAGALSTHLGDGAVALRWSGSGSGIWRIGGRPRDLSTPGEALTLRFRTTSSPTRPLQIGMQCGTQCSGWLDVGKAIARAAGRGWQQMVVPLSCFAAAGVELHSVEVPVAFRSDGRAGFDIATVALVPTPVGASCPGDSAGSTRPMRK